MDKFESIRAFTQVIEEGSFAAAARKMHLSRSAVNKLVINLENHLGASLLYRTTRQVTPTATGRAFYERCLEILSTLEEAELSVSQQHNEPQGNLKINAPMSFGIARLGEIIAKFMTRYSKIKIQLTLEDRFIDPISEGYDLVIRIGSPPNSPNLLVHKITTLSRVICASPHYLTTKGMPNNLSDLKQHSCLHYGYLINGSQWQFIHQGKEERITVEGFFCSNNGEVLRDAALQGLGIVMLPNFIVDHYLERGDLQIIFPDYQIPELDLSIIYPINRHLSTKIKLFTEFLQRSLMN
ncbi:transcriptional regulatory protein, LysR family [Crocosphaera subtropica ATCC 51142]|uniref:Transcriptional regulatory protein, LysR family n=1 Tax=Crocosphaera subtropica (strain ATCC 51142 / BH68) TaxID=43989 RepID=B1X1S1_CROS5|nr:LysR family transcriptional regulator [Crocosphaera subtropica]ACB53101.1 transcriptional regulatory protein, LysR family [Crocosphaera subtropica ATCC 51142]